MARSTVKSTAQRTTKSTAQRTAGNEKSAAKSVTPKKRAAANVPQGALAQVSLSLTDLPEKPKASWSLREAVEQLQDSITIAMQRGYSYDEIVKVLASCDIHITASSLKRYLSIAKRTSGKPRRNSSPSNQAQVSDSPSETSAAPEAEPLIEMAPRRRGRAAAATKTAAKTKAAPRTTTSRKRTQK